MIKKTAKRINIPTVEVGDFDERSLRQRVFSDLCSRNI
jgi:hypothetical protein